MLIKLYADQTDHFIVDFMEVNLANFVDHVLAFKCDKSETPAGQKYLQHFRFTRKLPVSVGLLVKHQHGVLNLAKEKLN